MIAVIVGALWRLGRAAIKGPRLLVVGAAVAGAALLGTNEVIALLVKARAWPFSPRAATCLRFGNRF